MSDDEQQPTASPALFAPMAVMLSAFSVLALYAETILQVYVIMTSHTVPLSQNPASLIVLLLIFFSFILTSVISAVIILASARFSNKCGAKFIFGCLHGVGFGFLWGLFRLILAVSEMDLHYLTMLRLAHVLLQSAPFALLYSKLFIAAEVISVIQGLSLFITVLSITLALSSFNLRHKLNTDSWTNKLSNNLPITRSYIALTLTLIGAFLVISTRLASISLMFLNSGWWVIIPIIFHMIFVFIASLIFNSPTYTQPNRCTHVLKLSVRNIVMAALNVLDLVNDNIDRVMCKYVAFYSLFLVESIILLSFWLLGSSLPYIIKLISVIGILTCFISGLVTKFVGHNLFQTDTSSVTTDSSSLATVNTITSATATTILTSESSTNPNTATTSINTDSDIVSIIQAGLQIHRQKKQQRLVSQAGSDAGQRSRCNQENGNFSDLSYFPEESHSHEYLEMRRTSLSPHNPAYRYRKDAPAFSPHSNICQSLSRTRITPKLNYLQTVPVYHKTDKSAFQIVQPWRLHEKGTKSRTNSNPHWNKAHSTYPRSLTFIMPDMLYISPNIQNATAVSRLETFKQNGRNFPQSSNETRPHSCHTMLETSNTKYWSFFRDRDTKSDTTFTYSCSTTSRASSKNVTNEKFTNVWDARKEWRVLSPREAHARYTKDRGTNFKGGQRLALYPGRFDWLPQNHKKATGELFLSSRNFEADVSTDTSFVSTTDTLDLTITGASGVTATSSVTSDYTWTDDVDCSATWPRSESRFERVPKFRPPGDSSQLAPSETVLRWLEGTSGESHI